MGEFKRNLEKRKRKREAAARRKKLKKGIGEYKPTKETYWHRNLLLKEMGFSSYGEYLRSDLWKSIKASVFPQLPKPLRCKLCPMNAAVVHHLTYSREVLRGDNLRGMVLLCRTCHHLIEFDEEGGKRTFIKAKTTYHKMLKEAKVKGVLAAPMERGLVRAGWCVSCENRARKKSKFCRPCELQQKLTNHAKILESLRAKTLSQAEMFGCDNELFPYFPSGEIYAADPQ